jgi:hypothetical protein
MDLRRMTHTRWSTILAVAIVVLVATGFRAPGALRQPISASTQPPAAFPHRIWAACDFEGTSPDYGWFGPAETNQIPRYAGNRTALGVGTRPYQTVAGVMTGINPVPGPRMGKENHLFLRYFLSGTTEATFQHFSLTREDNWHVPVKALATNRWSELALNFTRDARRNDGSSEPFVEGERMDDFKVFAGLAANAAQYQLYIDDVIFFANDPALPPEPEPFPNRIIFLAGFDTGEKEKYWPGDFELSERPPAGGFWRAAKSVPQRGGTGQFISLPIEPPRPVGTQTKLRFRYYASGFSTLTVQIFDATVQDNRHIRLTGIKPGVWTTQYLDFSRDARRNDGTVSSAFPAGNLVDAVFFFPDPAARDAVLFVDEVVLFDAGNPRRL